ncbi:hypothetical protein HOE425_320090 [Hoeflea sp. EC-HK425]|nr:hypothetical protein HOE425_320090 [Hoeflea sp. EC-HK425]
MLRRSENPAPRLDMAAFVRPKRPNWIGAHSAAARLPRDERVLTSPNIHLEIFASASGDAPNPNSTDCGLIADGGYLLSGMVREWQRTGAPRRIAQNSKVISCCFPNSASPRPFSIRLKVFT